MNVIFEFGELVVPFKDHPMACDGSIDGDPGRFSILGECLSPNLPVGGEFSASFLLQAGIMSCLNLVLSYSCSV